LIESCRFKDYICKESAKTTSEVDKSRNYCISIEDLAIHVVILLSKDAVFIEFIGNNEILSISLLKSLLSKLRKLSK
jgi:hypothetical protein